MGLSWHLYIHRKGKEEKPDQPDKFFSAITQIPSDFQAQETTRIAARKSRYDCRFTAAVHEKNLGFRVNYLLHRKTYFFM